MDRRHFIKLTAISGTTAALTACGNPENQVIRFIPEEELVPGISTWKPSVCPLCNAGCGVIARVMEGDAEVFRNGQAGVIRMGLAKKLERLRLLTGRDGVGQRAIAPLVPALRQQHHEALLHGQPSHAVTRAAVDLLQVAQHARQDVARRRRLQEQTERRLEVADQPLAPPIRSQPLVEILARQRAPVERIDDHLALRHTQLDQEVPRKRDAARDQAELPRQLDVEQRQRQRDAAPLYQHVVQIAVAPVVVVVDVAGKTELLVEETVQEAQPLHRCRVGRHALLQTQRERVDLRQHHLHVELRVLVLGDRHRRLEQREARVFGHQAGEVLQRARRLEDDGLAHEREVGWGVDASVGAAATRSPAAPSATCRVARLPRRATSALA